MATTAKGVFILRRAGPHGWEYATGRRVRLRLGRAGYTQVPQWSKHRDRARRWETRRGAARWRFREGGVRAGWGVEVVRIGTPPWVPLTRCAVPRDRQLMLF